MDLENFKIIKKTEIDIQHDKIMNNIFKQAGFNTAYVLGEIDMVKALIEAMGKHDLLCKEDLMTCLKSSFKDLDWCHDIINAIVKEYE